MKITPQFTTSFFTTQLEVWPLASINYTILETALGNESEIIFENQSWIADKFVVSYRKGSLTADPKAALMGERPCFLCGKSRPSEQLKLEWSDYDILVNPYPISVPHFTIAHKDHIPQRIDGHISEMASMTSLFDNCGLFYNGPLCGASAPDHLHFQAFDLHNFKNLLPSLKNGTVIYRHGGSRIIVPASNLTAVPFILIDAAENSDIPALFDRVVSALPSADPEPMMNIAAIRHESHTLIAVFPRHKHRPACYGSGEGQLLVSPATAEMLGTFPCAGQKEFEALDEETIRKIYGEVCVSPEVFDEIIEKISQ